MTIKARLWWLTVAALVGFAVLFFIGKMATGQLSDEFSTVVDERVPRIVAVENAIIRIAEVQGYVNQMISAPPELREQLEKEVLRLQAENKETYKFLEEHFNSTTDKALLEKVFAARAPVNKTNMSAFALAKEGKLAEASALINDEQMYINRVKFRKALQELVDYETANIRAVTAQSKAMAQRSDQWMLFVAILALLIIVGVAVMVVRSVSGAIRQMLASVGEVATNMRFNTRLPTRSDELNAVSVSMNEMLATLESGVADINQAMRAIAQGDFSQRITNPYVGDLDALKNNINTSADNLAKVMGDLEQAMSALRSGQFAISMSTDAPGSYGVMLSSVVESMAGLNRVVKDINAIMQNLKVGEFKERVQADACGDLDSMKQSVNATLDTLDNLTSELVNMAEAQMRGDLTVQSASLFQGRFKLLQDAQANSMMRIRDVINRANHATLVVNEAAQQVSQGASDLSSRVQEQAAALEQTSATMTEMTQAVQANTDNAARVAELTRHVQQQSTDGVSVMQETITAMQSIQASSSKIAEIVSLIDSIAFQTNLLALNAAVEAARAGEHGRGFAVVASEVRALAGKSADAAKDIKGLIEESVARIQAGTSLADKSGEMLNGISVSINDVAGMVDQMATASKEQSIGINQVQRAMTDIDRVTQENATLVEETTSAAQSLTEEAESLRENMSFFKTERAAGKLLIG